MNDARSYGFHSCLRPGVRVLGALVVGLTLAACGGSDKTGGAKLPGGPHTEALSHEECSDSGHKVEMLDTNGDGKPDIHRVLDKSTGRELCRVVDLNHDSQPDLYEYFDPSGKVRRREFCYDDTGVVNAVEYYQDGKLVRREYDTSGHHRIDTWDWFDPNAALDPKTGRPAHPIRRERDTRANGQIDQWWTWNGDRVSIAVDGNGDGKPDPDKTLILGGMDDAGAAPVASAAKPPAGDAGAGTEGGKP